VKNRFLDELVRHSLRQRASAHGTLASMGAPDGWWYTTQIGHAHTHTHLHTLQITMNAPSRSVWGALMDHTTVDMAN